jgi:CheY-like chemotaxis protein
MIPAMRRVLIAVASGLALTALAPAQQLLVSELDSKLASLPLGSAAYYQASLDRVAALWRYDLREAARAGEQLWDQTKDNGPLGVAEAAAARVANALTEADGANAAAVWVDRATEPPLEADLHIRADYFLTRARNLCMLEKHSEELPLAIKSQGCAEQCGDWIRRIEAMMITVDSLPNRGLASVQKFCIALVDLTMPEIDGTEVIRQLRATGRQVSCVLMSGHADDYVEECARQLNPDRLLSKPFMMGEVRQVVMELTAEMHPVT